MRQGRPEVEGLCRYPSTVPSAHGLAAWELWRAAFNEGTVSIPSVAHHADFLIDARRAAAKYLRVSRGADILSRAFEAERAALASLQQALEVR